MRTYKGLSDYPARARTAITIGNFDGVHKGHQSLLARLASAAADSKQLFTVVTFDPHPQQVLRGNAPEPLVTADRKIELLSAQGVKQLIVLPFNKRLSLVEPEQFITDVLVSRLKVENLMVGANFRFGRMARGDVTMLRSFGRRYGFGFGTVRVANLRGRRLSSTEIRHAIHEGDVGWAAKALGRPHSVPGRVVKGAGRGSGLGYPTANLRPSNVCIPATGVYAGMVVVNGVKHAAAISVGTNPTFGTNPLSIEAFLMDFDGDLYNKQVEFEFVAKIRDQQTFRTPLRLSEAIETDVVSARKLL